MSEKNIFLAAFDDEQFYLIFFDLIDVTSHIMRNNLRQIEFNITS
jgi:hypothetical protein